VSRTDPEARAFTAVTTQLDRLDDEGRVRVLRQLLARYDVDTPAWRAHAAVQHRREVQAGLDWDRIEAVAAAERAAP
jgi:hypothetical protein